MDLGLVVKQNFFRVAPNTLVGLACAVSEWRRYEVELMRILTPRNRAALDIGASWGLYTYVLSRKAAVVHAFEPNPEKAAYIHSLSIRNCVVHDTALSCSPGRADLVIPMNESACATIESNHPLSAKGGRNIKRVNISLSQLDLHDFGTVGFVKIDVEGHELSVLRGGMNTLKRDKPTLFIEIERRHNAAEFAQVFSTLQMLGYQAYALSRKRVMHIRHFLPERDQNVTDIPRGIKWGTYIYNFLFVASHSRAALTMLQNRGFEVIE